MSEMSAGRTPGGGKRRNMSCPAPARQASHYDERTHRRMTSLRPDSTGRRTGVSALAIHDFAGSAVLYPVGAEDAKVRVQAANCREDTDRESDHSA